MLEENTPLVEMRNIVKNYTGVRALDQVSFTLRAGEVHALCGENGAGKSTLIKILTGAETSDSGEIFLSGSKINPRTPQEARELGIGTVFQEINLCENLSVAENIFIGRQPRTRLGMIDWKKMSADAEKCMARLNLKLNVNARLDEYSVAVQQMVAIASALDLNAKVLVLDEPTSSLDANEVNNLFRVLRRLKKNGIGIIFITHFFDQVFEISDRVTILRNGRFVDSVPIAELTRVSLVEKMLGKDIADLEYTKGNARTLGLDEYSHYSADDLGKRGVITNLSEIRIEKGRVTSFSGLLGAGRTETARLIFGIDKPDTGSVKIDGKEVQINNPRDAIRHDMGFCPENRKTEGIITGMSVKENIILSLQCRRGLMKPISEKEKDEIVDQFIKVLSIKTPSSDQLVGNLSGGNQQKVLLAKWLATDPTMLLLDEPTRGIDVGAKAEIQKLIIRLADEGKALLFISSETSEVARCADDVYIFRDRKIVDQLSGETVSEQNILETIAGVRKEGNRTNDNGEEAG